MTWKDLKISQQQQRKKLYNSFINNGLDLKWRTERASSNKVENTSTHTSNSDLHLESAVQDFCVKAIWRPAVVSSSPYYAEQHFPLQVQPHWSSYRLIASLGSPFFRSMPILGCKYSHLPWVQCTLIDFLVSHAIVAFRKSSETRWKRQRCELI